MTANFVLFADMFSLGSKVRHSESLCNQRGPEVVDDSKAYEHFHLSSLSKFIREPKPRRLST
jgi:hypothetical protein